MGETLSPASIFVLAGTNGAGKSSVAGARFRAAGSEYFNPDEATVRILKANPGMSPDEANGEAWLQGKRLLERAISQHMDFAFETTLGGNTITALLESAAAAGIAVHVWYVGLSSPELHIQRVRARVAKGGHDIPEEKIRERYDRSRLNLIRLLPKLAAVWVYDNSADADPKLGTAPEPIIVLHCVHGKVEEMCDLESAPEWAKPILAAALNATSSKRRS